MDSTGLVPKAKEDSDKVVAWVNTEDIIDTRDEINLSDQLHYADATTAHLFPHKPSKEDVTQGGLGDCYLLAALISVADKSPDFFQKIMSDNGTDVTIKLFDVDHKSTPHTFTPRYITLGKSKVLDKKGADAFANGSLWVQMLEKAFVAAGYTGVFDAAKFDPNQGDGGYGGIEGGYIHVAFEHLLGKEAKQITMETSGKISNSLLTSGIKHFPWGDEEKEEYKKCDLSNPDSYLKLTSYSMLRRDIGLVREWMAWLEKHNVMGGITDYANKGQKKYKAEIRLNDVAAYLRREGLNVNLVTMVITWLEEHKVFPGKRGTGKYSAEQLELFGEIVSALEKRQYVGASSNKQISRGDPSQVGFSGGEPTTKGLVGNHAYAVLDYGYGPGHNKEEKLGEQRWIFIQNPWQKHGRKYKAKGGASDNVTLFNRQGEGGFWLELADLTKRFSSISIGST